jgi:hypothetical protein
VTIKFFTCIKIFENYEKKSHKISNYEAKNACQASQGRGTPCQKKLIPANGRQAGVIFHL